MGLSLDTYLALTPFEFYQAYQRFIEKIEREREWEELHNWQVARWQVWRTLCPPPGKELSVFDLLELKGDKEARKAQEPEESNSERYKRTLKRFGDT